MNRPPPLRPLIDRWGPDSLLMMAVLKGLQLVRKLGGKVGTESWRQLSGIFLKKEYCKFVIAAFRLKRPEMPDLPAVRESLLQDLYRFIVDQPELHHAEELRFWFSRSRRHYRSDLVWAEADADGNLQELSPYFDERYPVSPRFVPPVVAAVLTACNRHRNAPAGRRSLLVQKELRRLLRNAAGLDLYRRRVYRRIADRIMTGTFVYFESPTEKTRFYTPDPRRFRHPGWGLSALVCRLSENSREVDLWWQFNHVSVDGSPMQEILRKLKTSWGEAGPVVFPAFSGLLGRPRITNCGDGIARMRFFADFSGLLTLRDRLNTHCQAEMGGKASFAGLLMWGLARHPFFRKRKMLLPVDFVNHEGGRELGLLIMRATTEDDGLAGFCRFQTAMNRNLASVRAGESASGEFLTLCTMIHPMFSVLVHKLFPRALGEIVGTMGLSVIRDSEVFVSPITDFQSNGFMSLGSVTIPTEDGRRAGSLCVCGRPRLLPRYYEAIGQLLRELPELLTSSPDGEAPSDRS